MLFKMANTIDPLREMEADETVVVWQRERSRADSHSASPFITSDQGEVR